MMKNDHCTIDMAKLGSRALEPELRYVFPFLSSSTFEKIGIFWFDC